MDKTPKFNFQPDQPVICKFKSTQPFWSDKNKWGKQSYGYNIIVDGVEYTIFASDKMHRDIQLALGTGDVATITKKAKISPDGKPITYYEVLGMDQLPAEDKFIGEMMNQANESRQSVQDKKITRLAIIKALIAAGYKTGADSLEVLDWWVGVAEGRKNAQNADSSLSEPVSTGSDTYELKDEDIPF